jgi:hypothetical protein
MNLQYDIKLLTEEELSTLKIIIDDLRSILDECPKHCEFNNQEDEESWNDRILMNCVGASRIASQILN